MGKTRRFIPDDDGDVYRHVKKSQKKKYGIKYKIRSFSGKLSYISGKLSYGSGYIWYKSKKARDQAIEAHAKKNNSYFIVDGKAER